MVSNIKENTKTSLGLQKTNSRNLMLSQTFSPENKNNRKLSHKDVKTRIVDRLNKNHIQEQGDLQAVGQLLGHKVDFTSMDHAMKTIIQLRKHGIQQQKIQQKQQIQMIASALDK